MSELTKVDRCQTCGSDTRELHLCSVRRCGVVHSNFGHKFVRCTDPWHSSPVPGGPAQSSETVSQPETVAVKHGYSPSNSVTQGEPERKLAFETSPDRGYTIRASYVGTEQNALIELFKDGLKVREAAYPAYRIWNIYSHADVYIDSEIVALAAQPSPVVQTPESEVTKAERILWEIAKKINSLEGLPVDFGLTRRLSELLRGITESVNQPAPVVPVGETAQKDFDALTVLIARTLGGEQWADADSDQILEAFDPWDTLRNFQLPATEKEN